MANRTYCVAAYDAETGVPFEEEVFEVYYLRDEEHGGNAEPAANALMDELNESHGNGRWVDWCVLRFG
ncbi:hypothetical protein [Nocardia rhizosphaerae]|uniref:Immunity protein Imm1 n=1 Tax=Nocardia rhizosphaerae TaxID=1691571 RepID=A0ABV8LF68_9NOCA